MASAVVFTQEYPRRGVSSFEGLMKQSKNSKSQSRKHISSISAVVVGTSEAVADSENVHHGQIYAGVGENVGYPKARFPLTLDGASYKRKSISLNANSLQQNCTGLVFGTDSSSMSKEERRELRKKLRLDLQQVRSLSLKLEAKEHQLKSVSHSLGLHTSHSDAHLSRTDNRCSMEKEVTSEPPVTPVNVYFSQKDSKLARQASFYSSECGTPGAVGKEKRTPKANQMYLNSEFLSGKERMPPPEKLKPKSSSGSRRNTGKEDGADVKRQKLQMARSKRMADIMKQCGSVLKKLMTHKHGWVFNEPVDVVKLELPDYHKVIKHPMDLGTVKAKLEGGQYGTPIEFAEDVQLTFSNAMRYNPKGNDVHAMADILRKIFDDRWKGIKEKLDEEYLKIRVEDEVLSEQGGKNQQLQDLRRHLRSIEDQIISIACNNKSKPLATPRPVAPVTQKKEAPKRQMTFDEKSKLSVNLEKLPGDKSQEIIEIIKRRNPKLSQNQIGDAVEIEVDIDSVDNETLWELHRFVSNCMRNINKKSKKKAAEAPKPQPRIQAGNNGENVHGLAHISLNKHRKNDVGDEDVDIDDDMPSAQFPPVVVEKDAAGDNSKSSSSSSSSSDSGSSSSDSDSGSSSGSESEAENVNPDFPEQKSN